MLTTIDLFDGGEWDSLPTQTNVTAFKEYLNEVWQDRPLLLREDDDEEARRNTAQRFFVFDGHKIRARNYTGFVQFENVRINVYTRVFENQQPFGPAQKTNAVNHLIKWLSYCNRIHFPFNELQTSPNDFDDWLEAFIFLFATYTSNALNASPHFAYEEVTEEMSFVRGRIAMQPYIQHNLATGKHHLLHCTYEPFIYDNLFNQIVKHTTKLLLQFTTENRNRDLLNDILFTLHDVSDVYCTPTDCDKVKINRLYQETDSIRNMCRLFLQFQLTNSTNQQENNLCLLLPMEVIFEEYVAGFLYHHFPELKVKPQASGEFLAVNENGKKVFQMRHDILIPGKLIIDTKYKFRQIMNDDKEGVSQHDLYQMVAYCYKRNCKEGLLLYPSFTKGINVNWTKLKVNEIIIEVASIDITEGELDYFEELQKVKFETLVP